MKRPVPFHSSWYLISILFTGHRKRPSHTHENPTTYTHTRRQSLSLPVLSFELRVPRGGKSGGHPLSTETNRLYIQYLRGIVSIAVASHCVQVNVSDAFTKGQTKAKTPIHITIHKSHTHTHKRTHSLIYTVKHTKGTSKSTKPSTNFPNQHRSIKLIIITNCATDTTPTQSNYANFIMSPPNTPSSKQINHTHKQTQTLNHTYILYIYIYLPAEYLHEYTLPCVWVPLVRGRRRAAVA